MNTVVFAFLVVCVAYTCSHVLHYTVTEDALKPPKGYTPRKPETPEEIETARKALHKEGFFQGDIKLLGDGRNAIKYSQYKWPNNTMIYTIESSIQDKTADIQAGMTWISSNTCFKFKQRTTETNYVSIRNNPEGCYYAGPGYFNQGMQELNLQDPGCVYYGTIIHELIHGLGFYHEQMRPDRDNYITVNYQNVEFGQEPQFDKTEPNIISVYNLTYQGASIMHYGSYAFSSNGQPTMVSKTNPSVPFVEPYDKTPTKCDVLRLNRHLGCSGFTTFTQVNCDTYG